MWGKISIEIFRTHLITLKRETQLLFTVLQQILVISPIGPCVVDRCYEDLNTDPNLISGFIAAVVPRMREMGYTLDQLHAEMTGSDNGGYMEIHFENEWISVGIASEGTNREKLRNILREVAGLSSEKLGPPGDSIDIEISTIEDISEQIDILVAQKGIRTKSRHFDEGAGILPVISNVLDGKMKPNKAAKLILKTLKDETLTEDELLTMKQSLKLLDDLIPKSSTGKLDDLQVVVKATYQGVSKLTVRMDNELMF